MLISNFLLLSHAHRKATNEQKEMKLLLDMYKGVSKEQRDKVQFMAIEKKLRSEIDDLRNQLKKVQVNVCNMQIAIITSRTIH